MNFTEIMRYLSQYGIMLMFVIILLEYLNLPGFPAGVIMPVAGIWISNSKYSFIYALFISVLAGLLGSWLLYFVGRCGGGILLEKYCRKFPKQKRYINEKIEFLKQKGAIGVFISKLLPVARTLISIPAGVIKMDFIKYTIYSTLGILIWNFFFIGSGYFFGDIVMAYLT